MRRYHQPQFEFRQELPLEVRERLSATVRAAIDRAVGTAAGGNPAGGGGLFSLASDRGDAAPANARKEVTVTVGWSEDDGGFFRACIAALVRVKAFGVDAGALRGALHKAIIELHRDLAPRLGTAFRGRVRLRFTALVGNGWLTDVTAGQVEPAPGQRPAPPDAETVAATESGMLARLLRQLGSTRRTRVEADVVNSNGTVELLNYSAFGEDRRGEVDWRSTRDSLRVLLQLLQLSDHTILVYAVNLELVDGVWTVMRFRQVAEVTPIPETGPAGPAGGGVDADVQEIIDDVNASRRLVLNTAAMLIHEQDPSRLKNIVMAVAPFALIKLARVGKLVNAARARRLENLNLLKVPKVTALYRGRYAVVAKLDRTLVETARELRASQAGTRLEDFARTNIAVARVRVNGQVTYLDGGNVPASIVGAQRGYDAEQIIVTQVKQLRDQGHKVTIEQLYSERIPCVTCKHMLDDHFPEATVFYTVPESRQLGEMTRGEALMKAYGL